VNHLTQIYQLTNTHKMGEKLFWAYKKATMSDTKQVPSEVSTAIDTIASYLNQAMYVELKVTDEGKAYLRWKRTRNDHSHEIQ
jgi:hypothetical protein